MYAIIFVYACIFFLYILVTFTGFNPNTVCNFPLSVSLSWIRFHSVIQLEKAWWFVVWIQWGGKTCFLIWNSVTGKIWEILSHWCMCVWVCLPSLWNACLISLFIQLPIIQIETLFLSHHEWEDPADLTMSLNNWYYLLLKKRKRNEEVVKSF